MIDFFNRNHKIFHFTILTNRSYNYPQNQQNLPKPASKFSAKMNICALPHIGILTGAGDVRIRNIFRLITLSTSVATPILMLQEGVP